jgi:DNA polymerase (family X)
LTRAIDLARERGVDSESDLAPLFDAPARDADSAALKRLRQMYEAGGWVLLESTLADLPPDLRWLYESGAVTLEQLGAMHQALGVMSAADLAAAVQEQSLRGVDGFDEPIESAIAAALPTLRASIPRIPLGRAVAVAEPLLARLRAAAGTAWAAPVGSLRRAQDTVGDIELVAATSDPRAATESVLEDPDFVRCLHRSERRLSLLLDRVQVGVRLPAPANAGAELLYLTGSARHLDALRAVAAERGLRLTAHGLIGADGQLQPMPTEDELYAALGLPCIPPEIREGGDEIAAARRSGLPALVSRKEIRGDLHMHTVWSDGRDSVEEMVRTCVSLGYEYLAITDHSQTSAASRNLSVEDVDRQADEIQALRERYSGIQILHGCEVDILPDGHLDFTDRVLERFDIVLASLHERAGQGPAQLLERYDAAVKHPLVSIITHPTNRLVPHRPGYDLDYDRLFEMAVATGTVLEIDGAPAHLDLEGALARRAAAAGVMLAVDSDCHRADLLDRQMRLGIALARRGWVEPRQVLNTRPLDEVRAVIAAKRAGR